MTPVCWNHPNVLWGFMISSALVFIVVGAIFLAPFWLFDGTSFLITSCVGRVAIQKWNQGEKYAGKYAKATYTVALISILVEVCFMIAAVYLWSKEMNPWHRTSYGRDGDSFFFCSLYSSSCNVCVVLHFRKMCHTEKQGDLENN